MQNHKLFGVRIDQINQDQALNMVENWLELNKQSFSSNKQSFSSNKQSFSSKNKKRYIVTPNVEIIMDAQKDDQFKEILNNADLAIPDSSHLGWALKIPNFPVVTGVDLMEKLCKSASKKGWKVGFLGGRGDVAQKTRDVLKGKYPGLKVTFAESGGEINSQGELIDGMPHTLYDIPYTDILFIAFGHIKQEKWMAKNLAKTKVKVMMAVGGAFDYISGNVPRASLIMRNLGMEWLFRVIVQPGRIKRFGNLVKFVVLVFAKT